MSRSIEDFSDRHTYDLGISWGRPYIVELFSSEARDIWSEFFGSGSIPHRGHDLLRSCEEWLSISIDNRSRCPMEFLSYPFAQYSLIALSSPWLQSELSGRESKAEYIHSESYMPLAISHEYWERPIGSFLCIISERSRREDDLCRHSLIGPICRLYTSSSIWSPYEWRDLIIREIFPDIS